MATVLAMLAAATSAASVDATDRCRLPGARTTARSERAAVLKLRNASQHTVVCDRRRGRLRGLRTDPDEEDLERVRLVGPYVAAELFVSDGTPTPGYSILRVADARNGRVVATTLLPTAYVITRRGAIGFLRASTAYPAGGAEAFRLDRRNQSEVLLDGAFDLRTDSLRVSGDVMSWTVGTVTRSASLGRAPKPEHEVFLPTVRRPSARASHG